jgi:hypothetical protein
MPTVHGMLGQAAPAATTLTTAYTVPSGKHATVRVIVSNRSSTADTYRIAVSPNGASIANGHYLAYDEPILGNKSLASAAFTVGDTDVVRVYSTNGNMSFSVTGIEEDD